MVLEVLLIDEVLLSSLCVVLCSVDIFNILKYISWCNFIFLATNNSSWLTQVSFVVLDILYLLDHNFLVEFILKFFNCWVCKFFYQYIPLYCLPILDCHFFQFLLYFLFSNVIFWISSNTVVSSITWFPQNIAIFASVNCLHFQSLFLSILISLLSSLVST